MANGWKRAGDVIATRRKRVGFSTQRDFARALNVSESTIGNLENGRRKSYSVGFLEHVEDVLGWVQGSVMRTVEGGKPRPKADPYLTRVHDAWPKLDEQAKRMVVEMVESALRKQ